MGVFAHPDDESWSAGGLLAHAARRGERVTVVTCTRGEAGGDPERRVAELEQACRALGVGPPRVLDLSDGRLDAEPTLNAAVAGVLEELSPSRVVSLGRDGAYGHRDHVAIARELGRILAEREVPWLQAAFDPGLFAPLRARLMRYRRGTLLAGLDPRVLGTPHRPDDLVLELRQLRSTKLRAIAAHRSQLPGGDPMALLGPGVVAALLPRERYRSSAGSIRSFD